MRLRTHILLWLTLATLLPMLLLVLGVTTYSERQYRVNADKEIKADLSRLASEIDRRLYYERQMIKSLASAPDIIKYLPVLLRAADGDLHPDYFAMSAQLTRFLKTFQGVAPGFSTLRLLDLHANTLIKVHLGRAVFGEFDGIESMPYAEDELEDDDFLDRLHDVSANQMDFISLPPELWGWEGLRGPSMLSTVYPLSQDNQIQGYFMVDANGEQIDKILEVAPRPYQATLLIAELNPDQPQRDGMILYDDANKILFADTNIKTDNLRKYQAGQLWRALQTKTDDQIVESNGRYVIYYIDYAPYSNQLVSWVIAARVDLNIMLSPFKRIRIGILLIAALTLLISLFVAGLGARQISAPLARLNEGMKRYAAGDTRVRVKPRGSFEIRQLQTEFNQMANTLERARAERDQAQNLMLQNDKLTSIGQMAAGIGHELNNPLNNILSLTKLLKRNLPEQAEQQQDLDALGEEARRASAIISSVLNFARQIPPEFSDFNVCEWINESISLAGQAAHDRCISLYTDCSGEHILHGDRRQLQQVLINLMLNSIHASTEATEIEVRFTRTEKHNLIHVLDSGEGIPESDLSRVFEPFYTTKPVGEGSGLGLSVSMGIMQRHDGSLILRNRKSHGMEAIMILPLQPPPSEQPDTDTTGRRL